jgi:hypothetical protein
MPWQRGKITVAAGNQTLVVQPIAQSLIRLNNLGTGKSSLTAIRQFPSGNPCRSPEQFALAAHKHYPTCLLPTTEHLHFSSHPHPLHSNLMQVSRGTDKTWNVQKVRNICAKCTLTKSNKLFTEKFIFSTPRNSSPVWTPKVHHKRHDTLSSDNSISPCPH